MPGLTIATDGISPRTTHPPDLITAPTAPAAPASQRSRSASPTRPPVSPITPTLPVARLATANHNPSVSTASSSSSSRTSGAIHASNAQSIPAFAQGRQTFTHSQPDQVAIPSPQPAPIDFDSNPDVLALKSAISILQIQKARAERDIRHLQGAKTDALADPEVFMRDLATGRVKPQGDALFGAMEYDEDDDDEEEEEEEEQEARDRNEAKVAGENRGERTDDAMDVDQPTTAPSSSSSPAKGKTKPPAWSSLPSRQTVVRCPPVNWSQYAVVGESLDKLHNEQLRTPSEGVPASVGPGGTYEFKGEHSGTGNSQRPFVGIAAPYTPGRDKLDKKSKGKK